MEITNEYPETSDLRSIGSRLLDCKRRYVSATEAKAGTNEKQAISEPASAGNVASEQTKTDKSADKAKVPLAADEGAVPGTSTSKK